MLTDWGLFYVERIQVPCLASISWYFDFQFTPIFLGPYLPMCSINLRNSLLFHNVSCLMRCYMTWIPMLHPGSRSFSRFWYQHHRFCSAATSPWPYPNPGLAHAFWISPREARFFFGGGEMLDMFFQGEKMKNTRLYVTWNFSYHTWVTEFWSKRCVPFVSNQWLIPFFQMIGTLDSVKCVICIFTSLYICIHVHYIVI